jgi:hypothetical protein
VHNNVQWNRADPTFSNGQARRKPFLAIEAIEAMLPKLPVL